MYNDTNNNSLVYTLLELWVVLLVFYLFIYFTNVRVESPLFPLQMTFLVSQIHNKQQTREDENN